MARPKKEKQYWCDMKWCLKCNTEKPITSFYKNKTKADGHNTNCIVCDMIDRGTKQH